MSGLFFRSQSTFVVDPNRATLAVSGTPSYTGIQRYTSAQSIPIPLHWGTRRITPNVIWQSDLTRDYPNSNSGSALLPIVASTPVGFGIMSVGQINTVNPTNPVDASAFAFGAVFVGVLIVDFGGGFGDTFAFGSTDLSSSNSTLYVPTMLALCEGPIDSTAPLNSLNGINRMWNGSGQTALQWSQIFANPQALAGAPYPNPPSPYYYVAPGSSSQTAWPFFSASSTAGIYPGQDLPYRGIAIIATPFHDRGHDGSLPQQSFEACKTGSGASAGDSYGLGKDSSPAYIVEDFLTNVSYGMGLQTGDLDSTSLTTYGNYCGAQGLWLSPLLTGQDKATDFVDNIALLTNTWIYYGGTGFFFVPLGDESLSAGGFTYTPDTTPAYNLSNSDYLDPGLQVDRADPIDCYNRVRIEISDRNVDYATNPIEWKDETLIGLYGLRDASDVQGDAVCDTVVGAISLDLFAKRMAYIRLTFTFKTSYRYILLLPGSLVTLSDPNLGLVNFPVRIRSVQEDPNGDLSFVAEEYPGTIGIARPGAVSAWQTNGGGSVGGGGGSSSPVGGGAGTPISTSGGTATLPPSSAYSTMVLFVAGDVIALPPTIQPGYELIFKHDLQRSGQPTPSTLEANRVTLNVPSGAAYTVEDTNDTSLSATTTAYFTKPTGGTFRAVYDGAILRWT